MSESTEKRSMSGNVLRDVVGFLVVTGIVIGANVALSSFNVRKDLTEEKLYQLSDGTLTVLENLEKPVTLKLFYNSSEPGVPVAMKNYAKRVEDLLVEYKLAGDGNIKLEKFDPKPDSEEEQWAQSFGVIGRHIGLTGIKVYLGLVATVGDTEDALAALDSSAEKLLEYNITRMITRVAAPRKPVLGVIAGLRVLGTKRSPYAFLNPAQQLPPWFAFADLQKDYEVRDISSPVEEIDSDVDALIIVHPKDLPNETLYAIDQFLLRGGDLAVFLDPLCSLEAERQRGMPPMGAPPSASSDLPVLLDAWGVKYDSSQVVADRQSMSMLRTPDGRLQQSAVWLTMRGDNFNRDDILSSRLEYVTMPFAGAFTVQPPEGVESTPLIISSEIADMIDSAIARGPGEGVDKAFINEMKKLDLAVRMHGSFKTAFPDGKPETEQKDEEDKDITPAVDAPSLAESVEPATVVLVADVDMLYDSYCIQRSANIFGFEELRYRNDNLPFFGNVVELLAGNAALANVRTRGKTLRPFEKVAELRQKAQEQYLMEQKRLEAKLEEVQTKLRQLPGMKIENQRVILSPEVEREIAAAEQEMRETNEALRLLRRKLREEIEKLGARLKVINILLMPVMVCCFGVAFGVYRRRLTR